MNKKRFIIGIVTIAAACLSAFAFTGCNAGDKAKEKWERRCKRINWNKLLVKMNDQNECSEEHLRKFCELNFKNKLFFTVNKSWKKADYVKIFKKKGPHINSLKEPFGKGYNGVNINNILNSL